MAEEQTRTTEEIAAAGKLERNNGRRPLFKKREPERFSDPDVLVEDGFLVLRAKGPSDAVASVNDAREDRTTFLSRPKR